MEEIVKYIKKIMSKVQIIMVPQMATMLEKKFNLDSNGINKAVYEAEKNGILIVSASGYLITKALYLTWTHDKFFDNLNRNQYTSRLGKTMNIYEDTPNDDSTTEYKAVRNVTMNDLLNEHREYLSMLKALWVIAETYPESENFEVTNTEIFPIGFTYTDGEKSKFVQIGYFPSTRFDYCVSKMALMDAERLLNNGMRDCVERIALLTDERDAISIPYLGFKYFVNMVSKSVSPNRMVKVDYERADDERWADSKEYEQK